MTQTSPTRRAYAAIGSKYYAYLLAALSAVVIISGIGASKAVSFGFPGTTFSIITDGGFFIFPLAYILGDVVTEVYGVVAARRAIIVGFAVNILSALAYWIIIALPGMHDDFGVEKQKAIEGALGPVWGIVLAGLLGFLVGQSSNSLIMWWGKRRHGEKGLIMRLASSTGVGEFLDTLVFCSVAAPFIGISTWSDWANYTFFGFVYKVCVQYLLMPVTAACINWLKHKEPTYQEALNAASATAS